MADSVMSAPVEEMIAVLLKPDEPLQYTTLADLSGLGRDDFKKLKQAWGKITLKRRREIIGRLVELGEDNAVLNFDDIFTFCLGDEDSGVRSRAIEGLWECEEPSIIDTMVKLLIEDSSEAVQSAAAVSLGKFALLAELGKLRSRYADKVAGALLTILSDKKRPPEVWRRVLESAAALNLPQVKKAIDAAYRSDKYELKVSAIYAMGKNCDPSWLPLLFKELDSADDEIRYEAVGACGEIGEEEAVPYLAKLINDPDIDIRQAVIQALGKIGGSEARDILKQFRDADNEAMREAVEEAMDELDFGEDPLSFKLN